MFCTNCGKEIDNNAVICVHCGVPVQKQVNSRYIPQGVNQNTPPKTVNAFGIAGFVIGLLSLWLGLFFCIPALLGLVFSIIGMANMKKCNSVNGLAVAGLVLSIFATLIWATIWIAFAVTGGWAGVY